MTRLCPQLGLWHEMWLKFMANLRDCTLWRNLCFQLINECGKNTHSEGDLEAEKRVLRGQAISQASTPLLAP